MRQVLLLLTALTATARAQSGQWTWIKGSSSLNQSAVWGTQGVPAASNTPPSLLQPFFSTALDGTFWLYGGRDGVGQGYAALWKYDPTTNEWTWMKGPTTTNYAGSFGTQGVPSASNLPPSKSFGGTTWTDLDGNFWMYGGVNGDSFDPPPNNDLWKYDPTTNEWTWMKGSSTDNPPPVWGVKGVPDIDNQPPATSNGYATWTDDQGDLWMFGGYNDLDGFGAQYNAMWRYTIATNTWTWMSGDSVGNAPAVYGTLGVPDPANTPDGRYTRSLAKAGDGTFWMYGGTLGGNWVLNDLWRFDPTTAMWTWMDGSQTAQQPPVHGTQCITASGNDPGRRIGINWQGIDGRWWTFGNCTEGSFGTHSNDLWTYCPVNGQWTWAAGPSTTGDPGSFGTLGVASPTNRPIGRNFCATWTAQNGDLYLFGGLSIVGAWDAHQDMWKFTPDASCGACSSTGVTGIRRTGVRLSVSPNPSPDGGGMIELPDGTWDLAIVDATGRTVMEHHSVSGMLRIEGHWLTAGIHHVYITNGTQRESMTWIVE